MSRTCFFLSALRVPSPAGHGGIIEPPARVAYGLNILEPGCAGGSCLWFVQGTTIGCAEADGVSGLATDKRHCKDHFEPTIKFDDKHLRTIALNDVYRLMDFTKYHPWRYPGTAPVPEPCGIAGGWYHDGEKYAGTQAPPGVAQGASGLQFPYNQSLYAKTEWVAGTAAEVAWSMNANHGGGYQYRLCPAHSEQTEACFQAGSLKFAGNTQWIQFGNGMDANNRTEVPATTVPGDLVVPKGSTWRKNPIPMCNSPVSGGSQAFRRAKHRFDIAYLSSRFCFGPTFEPPMPGLYGFGGATCGSEFAERDCTTDEYFKQDFHFSIVDKVEVPSDLAPGEYTLSFRWDSEQTSQVWVSCADVKVKASGLATKPFSPQKGCDICCPEKQLACSNCTACLTDKTGDCAYCWNPLPGYNPVFAPPIICLGHETEDGGAPIWTSGMEMPAGWSPGCSKCWAEESGCKPYQRQLEEPSMVV